MKQITDFHGKNFWLSNFYGVDITYNGITYSCVEAAYQAQKTLDESERLKMSKMTASEAKEYGQTVKIRQDWNDIKVQVMEDLLILKFSNNNLKEKLLKTKNIELIEGNDWDDTFWGVSVKTNQGKNTLGKLLMKIRDYLKTSN